MTSRLFKQIADMRETDSLVTQLRHKRFALFRSLFDQLPRPVRLLDVGGTWLFWKMMGFTPSDDFQITLLNLTQLHTPPFVYSIVGDGRDMRQFGDQEFDVV